jgi:hypothetical protein
MVGWSPALRGRRHRRRDLHKQQQVVLVTTNVLYRDSYLHQLSCVQLDDSAPTPTHR